MSTRAVLERLSEVLWRERHLLELLLFKLEEEQLVLTSGRTRWLGHATREVETVLEEIRTAELEPFFVPTQTIQPGRKPLSLEFTALPS